MVKSRRQEFINLAGTIMQCHTSSCILKIVHAVPFFSFKVMLGPTSVFITFWVLWKQASLEN